jgi:tetratricopeptide (TPR) repeat protein
MSKKGIPSVVLVSLVALYFIQAGHLWTAPEKDGKEPEVISLLGKKLYATPATGEKLLKLEMDLKDAMIRVERDPEDPENLILYGRRLAYLWRYHEAIEVYSKGIAAFPDYAMLYRHRGHRYISTRASELNDHDFDIWYHLGLAHYLEGDFDQAHEAYRNCLAASGDDDAKIAISNWLYITLRRLGQEQDALGVLEDITEEMDVVENQSYHNLLLFYKGLPSEEKIRAAAEASDLDLATTGYGLGCWYLYNGEPEKAKELFENICGTSYWPAFGFIAAEAELFRQ